MLFEQRASEMTALKQMTALTVLTLVDGILPQLRADSPPSQLPLLRVHLLFIAASGIRCCYRFDFWNPEPSSFEKIERIRKLKTENSRRFDIRDI
ncbi:hypothetical protein J6590_006506 [Homalodisca vitripennis]|nr:hypothetical protein J6590_006506 [Homalodisca vitripennis]